MDIYFQDRTNRAGTLLDKHRELKYCITWSWSFKYLHTYWRNMCEQLEFNSDF